MAIAGINSAQFYPQIKLIKRNYSQSVNNTQTNGLTQDTFVKTNNTQSYYEKELDRLFPNGELHKIYNDISKEYGLENPPKIKLNPYPDATDYMATSHISNDVMVNLGTLLAPNQYKFTFEKNGKKPYCYDDVTKRIRIVQTSNPEDLKLISDYNKQLGADNSVAVPLTDDDKRKMVISSLAHELEHCKQNQVIRHTQGLDEFQMITSQLKPTLDKRQVNLIDQTILNMVLKNKYNQSHYPTDNVKIYSKDSPEGKKAYEWYNAEVNYINYEQDYNGYKNNPIEKDANERAHEYLVKHYGEFELEDK